MMRCAVLPPFVSSSPCSVGLCRERTELVRCALLVPSTHHKHSRGRWDDNRSHLERGWEKGGKQDRSWVGPGTSPALQAEAGGFPSPEQEVCAHLVTREPSSSWAVCTSQPCAFQQEVASSDLGGTRPKGGNPLGSRREGDRGTPGPLLPPKANARSQSSGCQRATACLEGRVSQKHRSPGIDWLYEPIKQVFLKFTLR